MVAIKAYTDLEQSRKLAEILPLESADMFWQSNLNSSDRQYLLDMGKEEHFNIEMNFDHYEIGDYDIPAWSLTALIDIIENIDKRQKVEVSFTHNGGKYWVDIHFDEFGSFCQDHELYNSKVAALVAIIEKIKNRGLL